MKIVVGLRGTLAAILLVFEQGSVRLVQVPFGFRPKTDRDPRTAVTWDTTLQAMTNPKPGGSPAGPARAIVAVRRTQAHVTRRRHPLRQGESTRLAWMLYNSYLEVEALSRLWPQKSTFN